MMDLEKIDITNFLPHRKPFLMVDKVLSLSENHVETSFYIKEDSVFIDNNVFVEAGLIEFGAQTCSSIVGKTYFDDDDIEGKGKKLIGFISAIKEVQVIACPNTGSTIIAKANLISRYDTDDFCICTLKCKIFKDEKELLSCEMNLFIREMQQNQNQ